MQWSKITTLILIMSILPVTFLSGCTKKNFPASPPVKPLILADNGICNVSIHNVAAAAPSTVETFAAEELQAAFKLACGVTPEINPASPAAIEIRLGVADQFSKDVGDDNEQAYAVRRTKDGHIELVGNCKAAVMWAVDDFCKEVLHVSWPVTYGGIMLKGEPKSTVAIGRLCKIEAPDFPVRGWIIGVNTDGYHYDDTIGKWMAHNRQNTIHTRIDEMAAGGGYDRMLSRGITVDTTMHTFGELIPPEMYDEHPEYFSLIDGKRVRPGAEDMFTQRCVSNPDVSNIIIGKIKQGFAKFPDVKVFGVGQQDGGGGWCQCSDCVAMDGTQTGTGQYSNRLIRFINKLANAIAPTHPDKYVGTFSYGEARRPPDIDIADNVSITFCYGGGNYMKKLSDPDDPTNAAAMVDIKGWLKKSKNIHFWEHYWTSNVDSCLAPYARTVTEGYRDLKKLGLKGICGETRPPYWPGQRFFFYAVARKCWDTSLDFDEILDDYSNEAYGPAASAMKSFYLLYEDRIYKHVPALGSDGPAGQFFPGAFSSDDMDKLEGYLTSAEAAVAGGFQGNIDAIAEMRGIFDNFKAISIDPTEISGIGPNLITNPGAEDGSGDWTSDIFMSRGDYSFSIPTGGAHSGDRCFKIECTGKTGPAARWFQTKIPITVGKKYAFSFWLRASGGAGGKVELFQGDGWGHYTPVGWKESGDQWIRLVIPEFTADHPTISVYLSTGGSGTVYFDDVFIAELPN
jgi:hypothetical protein